MRDGNIWHGIRMSCTVDESTNQEPRLSRCSVGQNLIEEGIIDIQEQCTIPPRERSGPYKNECVQWFRYRKSLS